MCITFVSLTFKFYNIMKTIKCSELANKIQAYKNCVNAGNIEWKEHHLDSTLEMCNNLPHGSGIDNGMGINIEESTGKKLVFEFSYHHMNEDGYYDGWTNHKLIITPAFGSYDMNITGRDRNNIKDYLYQLFNEVFIP